jgi:hypothetical protein
MTPRLPRTELGEGKSLARRLRLLRRRTARWFQPPVRSMGGDTPDVLREAPNPVLSRGLKAPRSLH